MYLEILPKLGLFFSVFSRNYIKLVIFDILMTITLRVNITRRMASFFHLLFELYTLIYLIFAFQKLKISVPCDLYFLVSSGLQNTDFRTKDDTIWPVNIDIFFLKKVS